MDIFVKNINEYLKSVSYNVNLTSSNAEDRGVCFDLGYCVKEIPAGVDGKYYKVNIDKDGLAYVNVPWENDIYTLPTASNTTLFSK